MKNRYRDMKHKLRELFYDEIKTADIAGENGTSYMGRRIRQVIFKEDMEDLYNNILKWHSEEIRLVLELLKQDSINIYTKEYGNLDVVSFEIIDEALENLGVKK